MRIHSDVLTSGMVREAARVARVDFTRFSVHNSRSHKAAFDVILTGESRRHQNGGPDKAATWDQWGVFLSELYNRDPNMKTPSYKDAGDFDFVTDERFALDDSGNPWPADAHGDHTFRYSGTPYQQECTKCSAVIRWKS